MKFSHLTVELAAVYFTIGFIIGAALVANGVFN